MSKQQKYLEQQYPGGYQKLEKINREIDEIIERWKGRQISQEDQQVLDNLIKHLYEIDCCLSEEEG